MEEILNDPDWQDELNDIAEDITLAYAYRKDLEKAPKKLHPKIREWDVKLLSLGDRLGKLHKPAYEYFKEHFSWLHHHSPATGAETATKS